MVCGSRFSPERVALRKIVTAGCASLDDLRVPPGNRLEALKGDRAGQYSIRVNERYRSVLSGDRDSWNVEIVDYHK
ncbi:MAG: type II toxin-antitoxin system RelE/ParE family toxin [Collinsella aerofaciens]